MVPMRRSLRVSLPLHVLLLLLLLLPVPTGLAQAPASEPLELADRPIKDLTLEELLAVEVTDVYTASRRLQKISEAPASVSILTAEDFKLFGYRTLADALRSVRSTYVTYDRNYSYLGMRGFGLPADYNNRELFLVDGHRVNDPIYDGALFGNEFVLDADLIERVEVVRGPGSSLYGSNAFFGVVNVMTRKGRQLDGIEVSTSAGSFGTYKGRLSYGTRLEDGPEVLLSASLMGSDGQTLYFPEYDDPATRSGFARGADGELAWNLFGEVSWQGFTLQGAYVSREKHVPTGSYGTLFSSRDTVTWDDRAYLDLKYENELAEKITLLARVNLDAYWYYADYQYDAPPLYLNKDSATGCAWGGEVQLSRPFFDERALVTVGGEFRDNFLQDQKNYDYVSPRVTYLDSRESSYVLAAYAQADVRVLDTVRLNVGLRYDYYDTFGSSVSPRAGLIVNPAEQTALKALYGRAFRAPSAYELYYSDNGLYQKVSPGLDPETIDTVELVVEQGLVKGVQVAATGFYYSCHDLITARLDPGDGLVYFDNANKVRTVGGELELRALLEGGYRGTASYSWQDAVDFETGGWLTNSPRNLVKLNLSAPVGVEHLFTGFELQYVGRRKGATGESVHGYVLANLTLFARELAKGLELSASVYNLFDQRFGDPAGREHLQEEIEQDGMSFRVKLTYRF
jgi:outer membrane receptor for ferrienterochelin and colicins